MGHALPRSITCTASATTGPHPAGTSAAALSLRHSAAGLGADKVCCSQDLAEHALASQPRGLPRASVLLHAGLHAHALELRGLRLPAQSRRTHAGTHSTTAALRCCPSRFALIPPRVSFAQERAPAPPSPVSVSRQLISEQARTLSRSSERTSPTTLVPALARGSPRASASPRPSPYATGGTCAPFVSSNFVAATLGEH